jgi:hypothetical protein
MTPLWKVEVYTAENGDVVREVFHFQSLERAQEFFKEHEQVGASYALPPVKLR